MGEARSRTRAAGDEIGLFHPETRAAWRAWLEGHHASVPGVWLATWKRSTGKPSPRLDEIIEEALCFGWIDSRAGTLDEERSLLLMTPRRAGSAWSRSNKERVERLIAEGRMTPAGLAAVESAQRDGRWSRYDAADALILPDDLAAALRARPAAEVGFSGLSEAARRTLLRWLIDARRPATRAARIEVIVTAAVAGRSPLARPGER